MKNQFTQLNQKKSFSFFIILIIFFFSTESNAQQEQTLIRMAKIKIDSAQLGNYKKALQAGIDSALRKEPGVLNIYAVSDEDDPTSITILEIYASAAAYKAHLQTPHFKKYKQMTGHMIKSLQLKNVNLLAMPGKFHSK